MLIYPKICGPYPGCFNYSFLAKAEILLISQYNLLRDELHALPEQGMNEICISPFTISAFLNTSCAGDRQKLWTYSSACQTWVALEMLITLLFYVSKGSDPSSTVLETPCTLQSRSNQCSLGSAGDLHHCPRSP